MAERITLEQWGERPAWHVRVGGTLVGAVYRQGRGFRAVREGSSTPENSEFTSREAAARAVARLAGHRDLDPTIVEEERDRPRRSPR